MGSFDALTKLGKLPDNRTTTEKTAQLVQEKPQIESQIGHTKTPEKTPPQKKKPGKGIVTWQSTRPFKKITCDIFLDQYEVLDAYILRYRLEAKTKIEMISLIREAIDEYIEKHHLK